MNNNECSIPAAFYDDLKQRFLALLTEHGLLQEKVSLHTKMLTPEAERFSYPFRKRYYGAG